MLELDANHKGFSRYLDSLADFETAKGEIHKQFAFMGDAGTWYFLWMVGRKVPEHDRM